MSSNHVANPAAFNDPISMLDASDVMSATQLRTMLEALHDNTAYSRAVFNAAAPGIAGFWAHVIVTGGVPSLAASYNVTSITDAGVGLLTVTIATDFSSANWACTHSVDDANPRYCGITNRTAGAVTLSCRDATTGASQSLADPGRWSVAGFGAQ